MQEPIFPVSDADFKGGENGRGCSIGFFGQAWPTQPSRVASGATVNHSPVRGTTTYQRRGGRQRRTRCREARKSRTVFLFNQ